MQVLIVCKSCMTREGYWFAIRDWRARPSSSSMREHFLKTKRWGKEGAALVDGRLGLAGSQHSEGAPVEKTARGIRDAS